MGRVSDNKIIKTWACGLRQEQIDWIKDHPEFNLGRFSRYWIDWWIDNVNSLEDAKKEIQKEYEQIFNSR